MTILNSGIRNLFLFFFANFFLVSASNAGESCFVSAFNDEFEVSCSYVTVSIRGDNELWRISKPSRNDIVNMRDVAAGTILFSKKTENVDCLNKIESDNYKKYHHNYFEYVVVVLGKASKGVDVNIYCSVVYDDSHILLYVGSEGDALDKVWSEILKTKGKGKKGMH